MIFVFENGTDTEQAWFQEAVNNSWQEWNDASTHPGLTFLAVRVKVRWLANPGEPDVQEYAVTSCWRDSYGFVAAQMDIANDLCDPNDSGTKNFYMETVMHELGHVAAECVLDRTEQNFIARLLKAPLGWTNTDWPNAGQEAAAELFKDGASDPTRKQFSNRTNLRLPGGSWPTFCNQYDPLPVRKPYVSDPFVPSMKQKWESVAVANFTMEALGATLLNGIDPMIAYGWPADPDAEVPPTIGNSIPSVIGFHDVPCVGGECAYGIVFNTITGGVLPGPPPAPNNRQYAADYLIEVSDAQGNVVGTSGDAWMPLDLHRPGALWLPDLHPVVLTYNPDLYDFVPTPHYAGGPMGMFDPERLPLRVRVYLLIDNKYSPISAGGLGISGQILHLYQEKNPLAPRPPVPSVSPVVTIKAA